MKPARLPFLEVGSKCIQLPIYFPSVSSVKCTLNPVEYVQTLNALSSLNTQYLISAYDLVRSDPQQRSQLLEELKKAKSEGTIVLMDSGNYESYWKAPIDKWSQTEFHAALENFPCDLAFGFDEQQPPTNTEEHLQILTERYLKDRDAAGASLLIPIVHGNKESLPIVCEALAELHSLKMIAVPERCLGSGIFERANTVKAIRKSLNEVGHYVVLHLLGTGNPLSLAIYAISGADSFDGLEWCQTVVDHRTALLHHFSQGDFFSTQTSWGSKALSYQSQNLAHNIQFYVEWMHKMSEAFRRNMHYEFCRNNLPDYVFHECETELGWAQPN